MVLFGAHTLARSKRNEGRWGCQTLPALGFSIHVQRQREAYGAFFIPKSYGSSIALTGGPEAAPYGFLLFSIACIVVTRMEYSGRNAKDPMLTARDRSMPPVLDPVVVRRSRSCERMPPSIPKLLDQPFWLDVSDLHRMASVMQLASRPLPHDYAQASGNWRHNLVHQENVRGKALHRVVAEGITPEQSVDEAIAPSKEILAK